MMKGIVEIPYLKKIGDNEMYLVGFRSAITDQEKINHWKSVRNILHSLKKNRFLLFLISSNGVPKH